MNNKARKLDLSAKFLEMGQALQLEGGGKKGYRSNSFRYYTYCIILFIT